MKKLPIKFSALNFGIVVGRKRTLAIPADSRLKHCYVCGGTGSGKSKFLEFLIRQDILAWPKTRAGLLLIDPHGKLFDDVMRWLAWQQLDRPVIPIDLRRQDSVLSYNLLRRRKIADPAVVVDELLQGFMFVWGRDSSDETPLLARRGKNVFRPLYEKGATLADAPLLLEPQASALRRALTSDLNDPMVQRDWNALNELKPREFEEQFASFINRLFRFIGNPTLRCIFGQPDVSLDLKHVIESGSIVLVNLATEGARISRENADLFATCLLTDLWVAAQELGKSTPRPFGVYLDEFHRFLTPTIAENLDQARGFGLALTLANQFPLQLLHAGPHGERIFDSIMETASSKVVFRLSHEDNLRPLAHWLFRGVLDPDEVKHRLYATKVMRYREEMRHGRSRTSGKTTGGGRQRVQGWAESFGESNGSVFSSVESNGLVLSNDELSAASEISSATSGFADVSSRSSNSVRSGAVGDSESWSHSSAEGVSEIPTLIPILDKEVSHVQFRSLEEQLYRCMTALWKQPDRHAVARLVGMNAPASIRIPEVSVPPASIALVDNYVRRLHARWPFFLPMAEALKRLRDRERSLREELLKEVTGSECATARRRIK